LVPAQANAALLVFNHSGFFATNGFGETATLGGSPLPDNTPFTYSATFDSTTDMEPAPGVGLFPATVVFDITGFGTFTSAPGAGVLLELGDPSHFSFYLAELIRAGEAGDAFSTASPPFSADSPSPSVLSGGGGVGFSVGGLTIPLAGGAGDLVIPYQGIFPFG